MSRVQVKQVAVLSGHKSSIYALTVDYNEPGTFYTGDGSGAIVQWDIHNLPHGVLIAQALHQVFSLHRVQDTTHLYAGCMKGGFSLFDTAGKKYLFQGGLQDEAIFDFVYSQDRKSVYIASGLGCIYRFSPDDMKVKDSLQLTDKSIRCLAVYGDILVAGASDHTIYVVDLPTFSIKRNLTNHKFSVFSVVFSPDGKFLLAGSRDAHISIWDIDKNFQLRHLIPAHLFTVNSITFSPNGQWLASAGRDKEIKIWDARSFELLKVLSAAKGVGHLNSVNRLAWIPGQNLLVSCSDDRTVQIWEIELL